MTLRLNTNIASLRAQYNLQNNDRDMTRSLQRLSSGYRINRSSDDALGSALSDAMTAQVQGLDMANRNAQDAISLVQTADGALDQSGSLLQRMRELAVQAANGTLTPGDRTSVQLELNQLASEVDRLADTTEFNQTKLLDGSTPLMTLQIGADSFQSVAMPLSAATTSALSLTVLDVSSPDAASSMITLLDGAIRAISDNRAEIGAIANRLTTSLSNLTTQSTNLQTARSRVRDLDMADEVVSLSRGQILSQTSFAMLAQANQEPQAVLSLLKGG